MERVEFDGKQNVGVPFAHYERLYRDADPEGMALRTGLRWDGARGRFALTLMGTAYHVWHPEFLVTEAGEEGSGAIADSGSAGHLDSGIRQNDGVGLDGNGSGRAAGVILRQPYEELLIIRYLLEGSLVPARGGALSYADLPWGAVYVSQFTGRVLKRLAGTFGHDIAGFRGAVESMPGLLCESVPGSHDAGYRMQFIDGLWVTVRLWEGDDEFPASAQMTFDDNIPQAFTAEDVAVIGDVIATRIKNRRKAMEAEAAVAKKS